MVWRFERFDHAIKMGAKLTVREGQAAVFINEGQIADVFTPGLYELETNNMPLMTTLQNWDHGFKSPFKAELYFINTTRFQIRNIIVSRFSAGIQPRAFRCSTWQRTRGIALAPWDLGALEAYDPAYLAGFRAEGYTVSLDDGYKEARQRMDSVIKGDVKSDIGGDRQRISSLSTDVNDVTFKHILLPIWLAYYKFKGKTFHFVVNGQSGEVKGERPYSKGKIALAVIGAAIVIGVIAWFVSQNR